MHRMPALFVLLLVAAAADAGPLRAGRSCIGRERDALLAFKQGLISDTGLESWQHGRQDCCRWAGITCSNTTGHVIQLDLGFGDSTGYSLAGEISSSLLSLEHLEYLNLNSTGLTGPNRGVPEFFGSFRNLRHLDLSGMDFSGTVPPQLGNLSKLEYLDLGYNNWMHLTDISWLTRLPQLVYLVMGGTNLSSITSDWPRVVNMLPSLEYLGLYGCSLSSANRSLTHVNLTNLQYLDLSYNYFDHPIASAWFWNITSITYLDLSATSLYGPFPNELGNMTSLQQLYFACDDPEFYWYPLTKTCNTATMTVDLRNLCDLEDVWLDGSLSSGNITEFLEKLPECPSNRLQYLGLRSNNMVGMMTNGLDQLTSLIGLDLSYNKITGSIPLSIGKLSRLEGLVLSNNHFTGPVPLWLGNCTRLGSITLSNNLLTGNIPSQLGNCTRLNLITLSNNLLTGNIPPQLGNCPELRSLSLSNNTLSGPIPLEIMNCTKLENLTLSNNLLTGHVPSKIWMLISLMELDLSNNNLEGVIPEEHLVTLNLLTHMDLSNNFFSGPLPSGYVAPGLIELSLSFNYFTGHIPESICCKLWNLLVLDLSDNFLEGELPHCSHKPNLVFLHLSHNRFSSKFPSALQNYSSLAFLDLSQNHFYGTLPLWIGDLVYLRFLQLSHNLLSGDIPMSITNLKRLRQLSLAGNDMSGVLPWSLSNLKSMTEKFPKRPGVDMSVWYTSMVGKFREVWPVVMKRQELKYGSRIFDVVGIDLSLNQLVGGIPDGITSLNGLLNLNLSWNHLSGNIPANIGAMKSIESLDLSRNNFSGEIPSSLSELTYLSYLDFSYNILEGRIPPGGQLDTLYMQNPSIYTGNVDLCGPPLERNCSGNSTIEHENQQRRDMISEPVLFFYFGLGSGFFAGLWVVFFALLFKKVWRVLYFRFLDKVYDNAYVFAVVTWGKINGKTTS